MKYLHSKEESMDYLRRALPMMSRQDAAFHPMSYAVWYEYVSDINADLKAAVDSLLDRQMTLGDSDIVALFERHIMDISSEAAQKIAASFQKILGEIAQSTNTTEQEFQEPGGTFRQLPRISDAYQGEIISSDAAKKIAASFQKILGELAQTSNTTAQETQVFGGLLQQLSKDCETRPGSIDLKTLLAGTQVMHASIATLKSKLDESRQEVNMLREEVARAQRASLNDGLTGLINRRGFDQKLVDCLAAVSSNVATSIPCLLMCDIDHFKKINDAYGHLIGDKVIRTVANLIQENVKGRDTAARYGGEEFVVLLPETSLQGAQTLAEYIRSTIEKGRIRRGDSEEVIARVTLSLGVARYRPGESADSFVDRADQALYVAKQSGRNRVSVAEEE